MHTMYYTFISYIWIVSCGIEHKEAGIGLFLKKQRRKINENEAEFLFSINVFVKKSCVCVSFISWFLFCLISQRLCDVIYMEI